MPNETAENNVQLVKDILKVIKEAEMTGDYAKGMERIQELLSDIGAFSDEEQVQLSAIVQQLKLAQQSK